MNTKNLIYASLIGGAIIAALSNIPIISFINCLLCAGVWGGAILAAYFYKRFEGSLTIGQGAGVGALAGVWAGLISFLLSFLKIAGVTAALTSLRSILPAEAQDLLFPSAIGTITVVSGIISWMVTILFGTIGGLIGGAIFQSRPLPPPAPVSTPVPPPSPAPVAQIDEPVQVEPEEPVVDEQAPEPTEDEQSDEQA